MKTRLLQWTAFFTLGMAIYLMLYFGWVMFYPFNLMTSLRDEFHVLTPEVRAGENIQFESAWQRNTDLPIVVSRQLIDTYIYHYQDIASNPPKDVQKKVITVKIPAYVEPGEYYFRNIHTFKVHNFREIKYFKNTEKFRVIK